MMKTLNINILLAFLLSVLLTSCNLWAVDAETLKQYANNPEHGLKIDKKAGGLSIELSVIPSDLMAWRAVSNDSLKSIDSEEIEKYNRQLYLKLRLQAGNEDVLSVAANNLQTYHHLVNQFAYGASNKAFITTSTGDTLLTSNYHFPRYYGMAPHTDLLFVFPKPDLEDGEWIKFHLQEIGLKTGHLQFKYQNDALLKIPELNFKS